MFKGSVLSSKKKDHKRVKNVNRVSFDLMLTFREM